MSRHRRPCATRWLAPVAAALALSACAGWYQSERFRPIAETAAATSSTCPLVTTTQLRWWSFRVEGCGETRYYRCWYKRHGLGTQCCRRVETENDASKLFIASLDHPGGAYAESTVCWN